MAFGLRINYPRSTAFDGARALLGRTNELLRGFGGTWDVKLSLPGGPRKAPPRPRPKGRAHTRAAQPTIAEVIGYAAERRDIFKVDDRARRKIADEVIEKFAADVIDGRTVPNAGAMMTVIAYRWRALVVERFESPSGSGDLRFPALSQAWLAHKIRYNYPTKFWTYTGQSLAAIRKAQPIIHRR